MLRLRYTSTLKGFPEDCTRTSRTHFMFNVSISLYATLVQRVEALRSRQYLFRAKARRFFLSFCFVAWYIVVLCCILSTFDKEWLSITRNSIPAVTTAEEAQPWQE